MAGHRTVNLQLHIDKPDNTYRFIHDWRTVASHHGEDIFYLLIHGIMQWGVDNPVDAFTIVIQYSTVPGQNVDISQPSHILREDIPNVLEEFRNFVIERLG